VIELDGSAQSGSGTLVRFGVALAAVTGRALHVRRARARRASPGLRPQHVAAVRACAALCGARVEGAEVGSEELWFHPGTRVSGGRFAFDIGTAGSTTMLALALLPVAALADAPVEARLTGGVYQDFAPSPQHVRHVLLPTLAAMGLAAELEVVRAGYPPHGAGRLDLRVRPLRRPLAPLERTRQGAVRRVEGVAVASHLAERRVAERMAAACRAELAAAGLAASIACVEDAEAERAGACLAVWAETDAGARLGADRAGAPRRSSEAIGRFVARTLLEDLASGAATDRHLADQLVVFAALAQGSSHFTVPRPTDHLESNLWLVGLFGAGARRDGQRVAVRGLGLAPPAPQGR
jgi:RNA 3'-terminal phosphate cyclase (ATP)